MKTSSPSSTSLNRGELSFLIAILVCLAAAVALLAVDGPPPVKSHGAAVGTITFKNRVAGRKISGEVIWDSVVQNGPVYDLDSIRTGARSSAIIHLGNSVDISLGEESLVLLDLKPDRTQVTVTGGSVVVKAPKSAAGTPAAPVVVATSTAQVSLKSGTLALTDVDSKLTVSLAGGEAVFRNASGSQAMTGNAVVDQSGRVAAVAAQPLAPVNGGVILTTEASAQVPFTWQAPNGPQYLEVASDSAFAQSEFHAAASSGRTAIPLAAGTHYWRVGGSPVSWFTVQTVAAPRLISPLGKVLRADAVKGRSATFSWTPSEGASVYRVQVSSRNPARPDLPPITTPFSNLTLDDLKAGEYSWTVTTIAGPQALEIRSAAGEFSVAEGPLPAPLVSTGAPAEATALAVSAVAAQNGAVLATWDEVDGADHYVATISRDPQASDVVDTIVTRSNVLQLNKSLDKGTYYVTVQAVSDSSSSARSAGMRVKIVDAVPPELTTPLTGARLDPSVRELRLRWSDANLGTMYRVQVASDSGFASPLADKVVEKSREAVIALGDGLAGDLFWRVALLDDQKRSIATSAAANPFLPTLLDVPVIVSPADGSQMDINQISRIDFRWAPVNGADAYDLSLYRTTAGLKSLVRSWRTTERVVLLDRLEVLATGPFSWELRAVSAIGSGAGAVITGESRPANSYFSIVQSSPLPAPSHVVIKVRK